MSGCYDGSAEDRYYEGLLNDYLRDDRFDGVCGEVGEGCSTCYYHENCKIEDEMED